MLFVTNPVIYAKLHKLIVLSCKYLNKEFCIFINFCFLVIILIVWNHFYNKIEKQHFQVYFDIRAIEFKFDVHK